MKLIWNYYELMEEVGVGSISTTYLVKAKRNRRTMWKKCMKDVDRTSAKNVDKFGFSKEQLFSSTRQSFNRFTNMTVPPLILLLH